MCNLSFLKNKVPQKTKQKIVIDDVDRLANEHVHRGEAGAVLHFLEENSVKMSCVVEESSQRKSWGIWRWVNWKVQAFWTHLLNVWTFDIYLKHVMKILCKTPECLKINIFHIFFHFSSKVRRWRPCIIALCEGACLAALWSTTRCFNKNF